jgi:Ca-activated chloride channel family protein
MTRSFPYATLALCACAAAAVTAQEPVFRATGQIVRVFVTATGGDGRLVTDLTQAEFQVRDDGRPQPIAVFDNSPKPIQLIALLDVSGSMYGNLPLLRSATEQLASRLGPDDVARLGTFGNDVVIGPAFTRDRGELLAALPTEIDERAPTPLWRAVDQAMNAFDQNSDRRPVVLVFSDGQDSGLTSFTQKFISTADVMDRARRDEVMVYAIGMRARRNQPRQIGLGADVLRAALNQDLPDPGLARVAEETGGGYTEIRYGDNLGQEVARVLDELHSQYLLGYEPPKRDGKRHKIDVRVTRDNVKPRARKNYMAPNER